MLEHFHTITKLSQYLKTTRRLLQRHAQIGLLPSQKIGIQYLITNTNLSGYKANLENCLANWPKNAPNHYREGLTAIVEKIKEKFPEDC